MQKVSVIVCLAAILLGMNLALVQRVSELNMVISSSDHSNKQSNITTAQRIFFQENSLGALAPSAGNVITPPESNPNAVQIKSDQHSEFFNVKATDVVIALFTIFIAIYTGRLVKATIRLETATINLVKGANKTALDQETTKKIIEQT